MSSYYKRALACFITLLVLMAVCGVRVAVIAMDEELLHTAREQSTRSVTVSALRGTIYDCNGVAITDTENRAVTVVFPCTQGAAVIAEMLEGEELTSAYARLAKGNPVTVKGAYSGNSLGAVTLQVPIRYSGTLTHLIGYTDGTGHGVSGLEKGMDDILYSENGLTVTYTADTQGRMLVGEGYVISGKADGSVTLTVDLEIQKILEDAMQKVDSGAAVVLDAESGKVRAMVSRPDFDPENIAEYLEDSSSPLLNRALCAYNVGSVFKPCVAAAALENRLDNYFYECTGSITYGELMFKCNRLSGHGTLGLRDAVSMSCNTFFYTLASKIGASGVFGSAEALRFGKELDLGGGIVSAKGGLPELESLEASPAALINLSIGQGELLLSPIAISNLYAAIQNGGVYRLPSVIEGVTVNGVYKTTENSLPTRAMSEKTAETLKEYLKNTLQNGTGSAAYIEGVSAGGKTGTAQTGWKDGDRSVLNGWFCGFLEAETADYIIVILKEDVKSGSYDCAPIFREVAENITVAGK